MKRTKIEFALLDLLRMSLWSLPPQNNDYSSFTQADWLSLYHLSIAQGVQALLFEAVSALSKEMQPDENLMWTWRVNVRMIEMKCERNLQVLKHLKIELEERGVDLMLLKGKSLAEFYPNPLRREYGDIDVYLFEKWKAGNDFLREHGDYIKTSDKHSVFRYLDILIENHSTFIDLIKENDHFGIKRNRSFLRMEQTLHRLLSEEKVCFLKGENIRVASPTFNFLFLLMHSGIHLGECLVTRHLCDWASFLAANKGKYNEDQIQDALSLLHFRKFCFLMTDAAIHLLGMPEKYAPSFYVSGESSKEDEKLADHIFYHFPGSNEVKKNTIWCKWQRFCYKQWPHSIFYDESLVERLLRTIYEMCRNRINKSV